MRQVILTALVATAMVYTGCSGGDEGGSGGSGGTAGTGGTNGPAMPVSFDETSSIPATAGAAAAMQAVMVFGDVLSSIFETLPPPDAATLDFAPKADLPGLCPGGGSADLQVPSLAFPTLWPPGSQVVLTLAACEGSSISSTAVTGSITLDILGPDPMNSGGIEVMADVLLDIADGTTIDGDFIATAVISAAFLQNGTIFLRLGQQRDEDSLTVSQGGQTLTLGCFDIDLRLSKVDQQFVTPLGVADFAGQVYTVNDYAVEPTAVNLSSSGVPESGELTLYSGDKSADGPLRTAKCFPMLADGDISEVTATFFGDACVALAGIDSNGEAFGGSTTWDKLLDFDFTPGEGGCGVTAMPPGAQCPSEGDIVVAADAYIRGGSNAATNYGTAGNLLLKGDPDGEYSRKVYMSFDLTGVENVSAATLVVTLQRHVSLQPQPGDLSGIIDPSRDWMPGESGESMITWDDAPLNDPSSGIGFLSQGTGPDNAVKKLVARYDFDIEEDPPVRPDVENTQYALDVTDFVKWAVGENPGFSNAGDDDPDRQVTLLMALSGEGKEDGLALLSGEAPAPEGWACSPAPFLDIEP
jgi:hypothetical protein